MNRRSILKSLLLAPFAGLVAKITTAEEPKSIWPRIVPVPARENFEYAVLNRRLRKFRNMHEVRRRHVPEDGVAGYGWFFYGDRRSGKTTALAHFVRERQLALGDGRKVAVLVPNSAVSYEFSRTFHDRFPTAYAPAMMITSCSLPGVEEVYADEIFQIPRPALAEVRNLYFGIGTPAQHDPSWNVLS